MDAAGVTAGRGMASPRRRPRPAAPAAGPWPKRGRPSPERREAERGSSVAARQRRAQGGKAAQRGARPRKEGLRKADAKGETIRHLPGAFARCGEDTASFFPNDQIQNPHRPPVPPTRDVRRSPSVSVRVAVPAASAAAYGCPAQSGSCPLFPPAVATPRQRPIPALTHSRNLPPLLKKNNSSRPYYLVAQGTMFSRPQSFFLRPCTL